MKAFEPPPSGVQPDFEKAEWDRLRAALKRSYTERFEVMMELIKTGLMLKNAKVTHKRIAKNDGD
jgi:hypothetical protein